MQTALPKQYLPLRGRPVILHTLERVCTHARIRGVMVGVAMRDANWVGVQAQCGHLSKLLGTFPGGEQRAHTVLNGLDTLAAQAKDADWVMVHDAVRPCVRHADIGKLIDAVIETSDGGLLALPIGDTVKRADVDGQVQETVSRTGLWRALTPQMFRFGALRAALRAALARDDDITDEATAMERAGVRPRVIVSHPDNIKVTLPGDIALAEFFLAQQERGQ